MTEQYEGYCMRCKQSKMVMVKCVVEVLLKANRTPSLNKVVKGYCVKCGTRMRKILPKEDYIKL